MNNDLLPTINNQIYRQFPEFSGVKPSIQKHAPSKNPSEQTPITYLLIYSIHAQVANNKSMVRVVRVVVNEKGKIIKVTTSR